MKINLLLVFFLLYAGITNAQVYGNLEIGVNRSCFKLEAGYLSELDVAHKAQIAVGIIPSFQGGMVPKIVYLKAGGQLLTFDNGIIVTPSIGIAHHWLADDLKIEKITGLYMFYSVDVSYKMKNESELVGGWSFTNNINLISFGIKMYLK